MKITPTWLTPKKKAELAVPTLKAPGIAVPLFQLAFSLTVRKHP